MLQRAWHTVNYSDLTTGDKHFLVNIIGNYVNETEVVALDEDDMAVVTELRETFLERAYREARVETARKILLRQCRVRFGDVPDEFKARVNSIENYALFDLLAEELILTDSLKSLTDFIDEYDPNYGSV